MIWHSHKTCRRMINVECAIRIGYIEDFNRSTEANRLYCPVDPIKLQSISLSDEATRITYFKPVKKHNICTSTGITWCGNLYRIAAFAQYACWNLSRDQMTRNSTKAIIGNLLSIDGDN